MPGEKLCQHRRYGSEQSPTKEISIIMLKNGWVQIYATTHVQRDDHGLKNTITSYISCSPEETLRSALHKLGKVHEYKLSQPKGYDHAY